MSAAAIRPIGPGDGATVARLLDALSAHEGDPTGVLTAAAVERDACGPARLVQGFLADVDGASVGLALWVRAWESPVAERGGFLTDLYVDPSWRGQGVGRALMAAVAAAVAAEGGTFLQLTAKAGNAGARAFYRRLCGPEASGLVIFSAEGADFARLAAGGVTPRAGSR